MGEGAYDKFKELATVFYEETPGVLVHPVWVATTAWFVGLEVEQEPRSDYVRYSFEFWEVDPSVSSRMERQTAIEADGGTGRRHSSRTGAVPYGGPGGYPVGDRQNLWGEPGRTGETKPPDQEPQFDSHWTEGAGGRMECWVTTGEGGSIKLPTVTEWTFRYGFGTPCDSFEITCLWEMGNELDLEGACRSDADHDGVTGIHRRGG